MERREFFKESCKHALPIIGTLLFVGVPARTFAEIKVAMGCRHGADCFACCCGGCASDCKGSCAGTCITTCGTSCEKICEKGCSGNCKYVCNYNCVAECKSSAYGNSRHEINSKQKDTIHIDTVIAK